MKVVILGPGAVGGLLAAVLWKHGNEVICVARPGTIKFFETEGLKLESRIFGNFTARPKFVANLDAKPDILFITIKAPALSGALLSVPTSIVADATVVPLMNGLDHMAVLKEIFSNVTAGSIGIEVFVSDGKIIHSSSDARINLASNSKELAQIFPNIAATLKQAGFKVSLSATEAQVLWKKFARLAPLALTTAATGKTLGYILTDSIWRIKLENCIKEVTQIARAEGLILEFSEVIKDLQSLHPDQFSSLARDIAAGKPSELDAIAGALIWRSEKYGLSCPVISELYQLIKKRIKSGGD